MRFSILLALVLSSVVVAQPAEREDKVDPLVPRFSALQFTIEDKKAGRSFVWGNGQFSLILFESGRARWIRTDKGTEFRSFELGYSDIANATFCQGYLFVFRRKSNSVIVHETFTGKHKHTFSPPKGVRFCAESLCSSSRRRRCYIGATDGSVFRADPRTGKLTRLFRHGTTPIRKLVASPDGTRLLVAVDDDRNALYFSGLEKPKRQPIFLARELAVAGINITSAVFDEKSRELYLVVNQSQLVRCSLRPFRYEKFGHPPPGFLIRDINFAQDGCLALFGGGGFSEPQGIVCLDSTSGIRRAHIQIGKGYVGTGYGFPNTPNIATADDEGRVRFWRVGRTPHLNLEPRVEQPEFEVDAPAVTLHLQTLHPTYLAVDPRGELVSAVLPNGEGRTWKANTGEPLEDFRSDKPDTIGCAFSPDGESLAVLCRDRRCVEFREAQTGKLIFSVTAPVDAKSVEAPILFTRDGSTFYVGSSGGVVLVGNVGARTLRPLPSKPTRQLRLMSLSPNDRWLFVADEQGKAMLVDLRKPRNEPRPIPLIVGRGLTHRISEAAFDLYSRQLYLAVGRTDLFRYDLDSDRLHHLADYPDNHLIDGMAIHPSCRLLGLIGGTSESTDPHFVHFVDTSTGEIVKHYSTGFDTLTDVEFSPDGHSLLTADNAGKVHYWAVPKLPRKRVGLPLSETAGHIYRVAVAGRLLLACDRQGRVDVWDLEKSEPASTLKAHEAFVWSMAVSADRTVFATGGRDRTVKLWSLGPSPKLLAKVSVENIVTSLAFSPDSATLAVGDAKGGVLVWDVVHRKTLAQFNAHTRPTYSLCFSSDGRELASGGSDGKVHLWDVPRWRKRATLDHSKEAVLSLRYLKASATLAAGTSKGRLFFWDTVAHRLLDEPLHIGEEVRSIEPLPDSRVAVSSSLNRIVVIDTKCLGVLDTLDESEGILKVVRGLATTDDGQALAIANAMGQVEVLRLWKLE